MLYELIAVVRPGNLSEIKEICRTASLSILHNRGTIRSITNWGPFLLPRPTTKHQSQHHKGHHFILQFDASSAVMADVRRTLELDPRMIRHSVVKIGDKLRDAKGSGTRNGAMAERSGRVEWNEGGKEGDWDVELMVGRQGFWGEVAGRERSVSE